MKRKKNLLGLAFAVSLLTLFFIMGCGGGGGDGSGTGTLKVSITDSPACGFDQVNVAVSMVRVHQSATANENASGWHDITLSPPRKINLTSLVNGVLEDLGQTALSAGHYTQLRLVLVPNSASQPLNNSVLPTGGAETPVDTPSGIQTGIKLIHEFDVGADMLVDLVLDFDACKSIVKKGNNQYLLKPVISVTPIDISGKITGFVDPALSGFNPVVFAEQAGKTVRSTAPDANGSFTLSPLQQSSTAGNYDLVVIADSHAAAMIRAIPVTANGTTTASNSGNPIMLNSSTTHMVSGKATLTPPNLEVSALIRATQTFSSGPTMEVRSTAANISTGNYLLTLPTGAPSRGSFGTGTLPITLTPDPSIAGKYKIEASAEGYLSQDNQVDISGIDLTQDFALMTAP